MCLPKHASYDIFILRERERERATKRHTPLLEGEDRGIHYGAVIKYRRHYQNYHLVRQLEGQSLLGDQSLHTT